MPIARPSRSLLALIGLLLVAIGGAVASPASAAEKEKKDIFFPMPKPTYPAFYVPPDPLPAGENGTLIRWKQIAFKQSITKPPPGTQGYMIMYLSTNATGERVAVTAYVLVPKGYNAKQGNDKRPLIGYGNEAMGLGDLCAQSRVLQWGHSGELALIEPMLKRGYAVVATDYEGLGTPTTHTFGVMQSSARAVLDSIRAARQLPAEVGIPSDGQLALYGYSQGGQGIAGGAEIAKEYAPELKIDAVAVGGAPVDPAAFYRRNNGSLFSAANFAASAGYYAAYPELDLPSFLNKRGAEAYKHTLNACIESTFTVAFKRASEFLKPGMDPGNDPRWQARFQENQIGNKPPTGFPIFYFHTIGDQTAPYAAAKTMRRKWCAGGTNLTFVGIPFMEHVAGGPLLMPEAAKWIAQRLEGKPAKSNCGAWMP